MGQSPRRPEGSQATREVGETLLPLREDRDQAHDSGHGEDEEHGAGQDQNVNRVFHPGSL